MYPSCRFRTGCKWLICALVCAEPMLFGTAAWSGECGAKSPEYTAMRTLTFGAETKTFRVYVSGAKVREEDSLGGNQTVVLRLPETGAKIVYDPQRRDGLRIPVPPPPDPSNHPTRSVIEKLPNGGVVRHLQAQNGFEWQEVSTTTCRADQVMVEQTFTWFDPHGKLLKGKLTQTDIVVGPLPKELFEVPSGITIKGP